MSFAQEEIKNRPNHKTQLAWGHHQRNQACPRFDRARLGNVGERHRGRSQAQAAYSPSQKNDVLVDANKVEHMSEDTEQDTKQVVWLCAIWFLVAEFAHDQAAQDARNRIGAHDKSEKGTGCIEVYVQAIP